MVDVSVLISVYRKDSPIFFEYCLASFDDLEPCSFEIILVEDGDVTTELREVISRFSQLLPIKSLKLQTNSGLANALNEGLKLCTGDYVARMDADDILLPDRLSCQTEFMRNNLDVDLCGAWAIEIDENNSSGEVRKMPTDHDAIVDSLWSNPFIHPAVMFKREKLLQIGGYDASLRRRQDYELWFRCAKNGFKFANIPKPLILYRFVAGTHKKQTIGLAWEQAMIGFKGASLLRMPIWKRLACFVPFFRSLLPTKLQHWLYVTLKRFDPRHRKVNS